ncbi:MAG: hypothetical protein RLN87_05140 [Parasphingopyxis sp.]|uniref:hypothetical protein n=2 Tax=Parasphingopyxis TaxID=1234545 RepID=UPI0026247FDA|nr:hypothetical protein [uncultured Parasphingopyxis sp.]
MMAGEAEAMTARRLILSLLNAVGTQRLTAAQMVAAARAFEIEDAAMRMAATRLTKQGLIESPERGAYVSGTSARELRDQVRGWRDVRARRTDWNGDWLAMPGGHLGRTDRKRLAARDRALRLYGFAEAETGLWVRPANLVFELEALRSRLVALGLDGGALLWRISEQASAEGAGFAGLWDRGALESGYREMIAALDESSARLDALPHGEAAREALLLGQAAIRRINLDPLLPDAMVDTALFDRLVAAMEAYDRRGKHAWAAFYTAMDRG